MPVSFWVGVTVVIVLLAAWVTSLIVNARGRKQRSRWGSQLAPQDDAAARAARAGGGVGAGYAMGAHHPRP